MLEYMVNFKSYIPETITGLFIEVPQPCPYAHAASQTMNHQKYKVLEPETSVTFDNPTPDHLPWLFCLDIQIQWGYLSPFFWTIKLPVYPPNRRLLFVCI